MFTLLLLPWIALGQVGPPDLVIITPGSSLVWNPVTTDVNGDPEEISHYTVVATPVIVTVPDVGSTLRTADVPVANIGLDGFMNGLPAAAYNLFTRAVDTSAQESGWSVPLASRWDRAVPQTPVGLSISPP